MPKITRDAFLYMDPSGSNHEEFGQCGACKMSVPTDKGQRCSILGIAIDANDSCGLFVPGEQDPTEAEHIDDSVSPKEAGYVSRDVRCENCRYFDPDEGDCELFEMLNKLRPDDFDLDPKVNPLGCCNAQMPIGSEGRAGEAFERM